MRPKQDSAAFARMMAQIDADNSHPKPDDGKIIELEPGGQPLVRVGRSMVGRSNTRGRLGWLSGWMTDAFITWSGSRLDRSSGWTKSLGGGGRCRRRWPFHQALWGEANE